MKYIVNYSEANRTQTLTVGGWFCDKPEFGKPRFFHTREQAEACADELRDRYPNLLGWFSVAEIRD